MHVSSKEVVVDAKQAKELGVSVGDHVISNVIEYDGAGEVASDKASLSAKIVSVARTASGGVEIKAALSISEPVPAPAVEAPKPLSLDDEAAEYLESKGLNPEEAKAAVEKFGAGNVLSKRQGELDSELDALVSK